MATPPHCDYKATMHANNDITAQPARAAQWVAVLLVLVVALLGVMAWLTGGDSLFVTLVQQGLAWCF